MKGIDGYLPMLATLGAPPTEYGDFAVEAKYDGQRLTVDSVFDCLGWCRGVCHVCDDSLLAPMRSPPVSGSVGWVPAVCAVSPRSSFCRM